MTLDDLGARLGHLVTAPPCAVDIDAALTEGRRLRQRARRRRVALGGTLMATGALAGVAALGGTSAFDRGGSAATTAASPDGAISVRLAAFVPATAQEEQPDFTAAVTGTNCVAITYQARALAALPCAADGQTGTAVVADNGLAYGYFESPGVDRVVVTTTTGEFVAEAKAVPGSDMSAFVVPFTGRARGATFTVRPGIIPPATVPVAVPAGK